MNWARQDQAIKLSPSTQGGEIAPVERLQLPVPYDSKSDDLMVSQPIPTFHHCCQTYHAKDWDTGGLKCPNRLGLHKVPDQLPNSTKMRIHAKLLRKAMKFEQADGSLMGGSPAIHLTEPVCFEMGQHWEIIRFVIIPKMTETNSGISMA